MLLLEDDTSSDCRAFPIAADDDDELFAVVE